VIPRVRISQFNLEAEAGGRAAFAALAGASRRVCAVGDSRHLEEKARGQECYQQALARAVQAVRSERLARLYEAKRKAG
jgi:UrcA family protein